MTWWIVEDVFLKNKTIIICENKKRFDYNAREKVSIVTQGHILPPRIWFDEMQLEENYMKLTYIDPCI